MGPKKTFRKQSARLEADALFDYAVKYLALRACSSEELRGKLRLKAARPSDTDTTIDRLKEIGYLNDERFAEAYATYRVENEGFGRMRILSDLKTRRVPGNLADKAVGQIFEGRVEADMIDAYIERRMSSIAGNGPIEDERELARAWRRLRRAGFSSAAVLSALRRIAARPELIEEPAEEENAEEETN